MEYPSEPMPLGQNTLDYDKPLIKSGLDLSPENLRPLI